MNHAAHRKVPTHTSQIPYDLLTPNAVGALLRLPKEVLLGSAHKTAANITVTAGLTNNQGYFALNWSTGVVGELDFIGLYPNSDVPENAAVAFVFAKSIGDSGTWTTPTPVQNGLWEARYYAWDFSSSTWVLLASGGMQTSR
jgi:hypothetical protein